MTKLKKSMCAVLASLMLMGIPLTAGAMEVAMPESVPIEKEHNTLSVTTSVKNIKISALKKAKKTVKPLTVKDGIGKIKITKEKSGTTSSIYKKCTVNSKTGAITIKKGKYKEGFYKIKLKVTASGSEKCAPAEFTPTVKIYIYNKLINTIKVSAKSKDLKISALKKAKKKIKLITVKKAVGKVTFKKVKKARQARFIKRLPLTKRPARLLLKKALIKRAHILLK